LNQGGSFPRRCGDPPRTRRGRGKIPPTGLMGWGPEIDPGRGRGGVLPREAPTGIRNHKIHLFGPYMKASSPIAHPIGTYNQASSL
jgi:hypothetical protein